MKRVNLTKEEVRVRNVLNDRRDRAFVETGAQYFCGKVSELNNES